MRETTYVSLLNYYVVQLTATVSAHVNDETLDYRENSMCIPASGAALAWHLEQRDSWLIRRVSYCSVVACNILASGNIYIDHFGAVSTCQPNTSDEGMVEAIPPFILTLIPCPPDRR